MEQVDDGYNKLHAQRQTIGLHHRRHLELEGKTDQNQTSITIQLKALTTKVTTVTTKTNFLEQYLRQISNGLDAVEKSQEASLLTMKVEMKQDQIQFSQDLQQEF